MKQEIHFYQPGWEAYTIPASPQRIREKNILISDSKHSAEQWIPYFRSYNIPVEYLIELPAEGPVHLPAAMKRTPGTAYRIIYPCTKLYTETITVGNPYYRLLELTDALRKWGAKESALVVLTDRVFADGKGIQAHPINSLIISAAQTLTLEYPDLHIRTLDYQADLFHQKSAYRRLVLDALLLQTCHEPMLKVGDSKLLKPVYTPLEAPVAYGMDSFCRTHGSGQDAVLITGGLGGVGLRFAEYFARQGIEHIYLTSRRGKDHPAAGSGRGPHRRDPLLEKIHRLGVQVHIETMDCTEDASVHSFFERVSRQGIHISGIVHAAAVNHSSYMSPKKAEVSAAVLEPKVIGTNLLLRYASAYSVELLMLCSSLASVIPRVGMAAYSAGNFYLDRMASFARHDSGCQVMSLNLDTITNTGMAGRLGNLPQNMSMPSIPGLTHGIVPEQLADILHRVLGYSLPQVLVCIDDLYRRIRSGRELTKAKFEQLLLSIYQGRR